MTNDFHSQAILPNTNGLLNKIREIKPTFLASCYLSGGTALSLYIGHRISEDLDLFIQNTFNGSLYQQELEQIGHLEHLELDSTSLNAFINGVKIQILHYPYRLLEPTANWNGISISSEIDVACTKLVTVSQRGSKKDFVDIYFLLKKYSLQNILIKLDEKYNKTKYNIMHILKSLTYFTDAELQPMPRMLMDVSWDEVKQALITTVKTISLE
jgi:predicted nucleotidyltransferase component of viral defense system